MPGEFPVMDSGPSAGDVRGGAHRSRSLWYQQERSAGCGVVPSHVC